MISFVVVEYSVPRELKHDFSFFADEITEMGETEYTLLFSDCRFSRLLHSIVSELHRLCPCGLAWFHSIKCFFVINRENRLLFHGENLSMSDFICTDLYDVQHVINENCSLCSDVCVAIPFPLTIFQRVSSFWWKIHLVFSKTRGKHQSFRSLPWQIVKFK